MFMIPAPGGSATAAPQASPAKPVAAPSSPPTAPSGSPTPAPASAAVAAQGPIQFNDIQEIFTRTWELFKQKWKTCLASSCIIAWVVVILLAAILLISPMFWLSYMLDSFIIATILRLFLNLIFSVCVAWFAIGLTRFYLALARGQEPDLGVLFSGGPQYLQLVILNLIYACGSLVISFIFELPGRLLGLASPWFGGFIQGLGSLAASILLVILSLMFSQAFFLIVDRNLEIIDSLKTSVNLTNGSKFSLFIISIIMGVIVAVSAIPCGLGLLVTLPFNVLLYSLIYLRLNGQPSAINK
jgi:hypothetical protein